MADHMRTELVTDALQMALAHRRPAPGLIWHSDQGSQFVSLAFGQQARAAGIAQSMGSKGDCFDNAVAESFFATLKKELVHGRTWPTKAELRTEVFEYIEIFFNRRRRHSTLGFLSPEQFETITRPPSSKRTATRLTRPCPPNRGNSTRLLLRPLACARWALSGARVTRRARRRHSQSRFAWADRCRRCVAVTDFDDLVGHLVFGREREGVIGHSSPRSGLT
jgi:hypothetical protein